jgi:transmembrane 9 superfamily protein 3
VPLSIAFLTLNSVAVAHSATTAMPFGTILVVLALFVLVAFPLAVLGGIAGKNSNTQEPTCRVAKVRALPTLSSHSISCTGAQGLGL